MKLGEIILERTLSELFANEREQLVLGLQTIAHEIEKETAGQHTYHWQIDYYDKNTS